MSMAAADRLAEGKITLPYELLELVIGEYWASILSRKDRIKFMVTSRLLSKEWSCAFDQVSLRDVYIPTISYFYHYRDVLLQKSPTGEGYRSKLLQNACKTLTFQRAWNLQPTHQSPSGQVTAGLMDTLYILPPLPNIQTIYLEYFQTIPSGEISVPHSFAFPLTQLDVRYVFEPRVPPWLIRAMGSPRNPLQYPWTSPTIRHVSMKEEERDMITDVLLACPKLENLRFPGVHVDILSSRSGANSQFIFHLPVPGLSTIKLKRGRKRIYQVKAKALGVCLESLSPPTLSQDSDQTSTRRTVRFFRRLGPL